MTLPNLSPSTTPGAQVTSTESGWRLTIPPGPAGQYRLAQLDDYAGLSRHRFPWKPPFTLSLKARASAQMLPGTWGFGLWNDPFSFSLGLGGASRRLPALPNAAWFFFASPPNYLSLHDDLPAEGATAGVFQSPIIPAPLLALGTPGLPLLAWPPTARQLRRLARGLVRQDTASLSHDPTAWHKYTIHWSTKLVTFLVDDTVVFESPIVPRRPLGLVLWVDNQYMAFPPDGKLKMGTLANEVESWIEVADLRVDKKQSV